MSNTLTNLLQYNYYINLKHRKDRKEETEKQLKSFGITKPNRFEAVKCHIGAIGCSTSHLKVLKSAKKNNFPCVFIFEDDVEFINPKETYNKLEKILNSNLSWDVIFLGGNNAIPYTKISNDLIKVTNCQTRTAYLVNSSYYDKLIKNFEESLKNLKKPLGFKRENRGDIHWKKLQRIDKWYIITPLQVFQKPSFSDIERRNVDYRYQMKSLDYNGQKTSKTSKTIKKPTNIKKY